jgi:hypothetical protein
LLLPLVNVVAVVALLLSHSSSSFFVDGFVLPAVERRLLVPIRAPPARALTAATNVVSENACKYEHPYKQHPHDKVPGGLAIVMTTIQDQQHLPEITSCPWPLSATASTTTSPPLPQHFCWIAPANQPPHCCAINWD